MSIEQFSSYLCKEYNRILKEELNEDLMVYFLSFENCEDLKEYVSEVIEPNKSGFEEFYDVLLQCWKELNNLSSPKTILQDSTNKSLLVESISRKNTKKITFSPLFGSDGKEKTVAKLPGRHSCECQAHKHSLVNNCLNCGRVVCDQEGSGPCFFCGSLVCTREEQDILSRDSKKSDRLRNFLMNKYSHLENGQADSAGLESAIHHKNKLLDFDRTSAIRTQVIDDESDYFATDSNQWLSEKQRSMLKQKEEQLRALRFASRKDRKVTIDFAGRQVIEEDPHSMHIYMEMQDSSSNCDNHEVSAEAYLNYENYQIAHPDSLDIKPTFVACNAYDTYLLTKDKTTGGGKSATVLNSRIQDAELQQMTDNGMALSMHQPWASLLVAGIKKHEGRTWYSNHRGVLWIASTSKSPNSEEIRDMENFYKNFYNDENIIFPKNYPASCLLGRVEVVDVLSSEDYQAKYPTGGESSSPYVFICENPLELKIKFPMKGKHKIYKLEDSLLKGAKKALSWT